MHIKGFKVQFNDKEICITIRIGMCCVPGHILYFVYVANCQNSLTMPKVDSTEERYT